MCPLRAAYTGPLCQACGRLLLTGVQDNEICARHATRAGMQGFCSFAGRRARSESRPARRARGLAAGVPCKSTTHPLE